MASWRIKMAAIVVAAGALALSWSGSRACRAEGQEQTSKKGIAIEEVVIEVERLPHYTELLEWMNAVKRPGFELLKAAKQNGYLIAVFKTEDGDVAICRHRLEYQEGTVVRYEVQDLDGNQLHDESDLHRGKSFGRTLKTPDSTARFLDGYIYPLRRPVPKKVRVLFHVGEGEAGHIPDRQKAIFNEVIEIK